MIITKESYHSSVDTIDEATGLESIPMTKDEPSEDFKKSALKVVDCAKKYTIKKYGNSRVKNGDGGSIGDVTSAMIPELSRIFNAFDDKIAAKSPKNSYIIDIPTKLQFTLYGFTSSKEATKDAENILKDAGYKKGSKIALMPGSFYFYKYSSDKKYIYVAYNAASFGTNINRYFYIRLYRCNNSEKAVKLVTESTTEIPDEREAFTRYFDVEDVEPSIADIEDDSREEFYRDPVFNKAISEHFNILDKKTRKTLLSLDEAGQNSVVMSLTSKLYDKIVDKCEDIDYGEIPATKGDITKLSKYDSMKETISIMHDLLREYNQNTGPVDELSVAFSNVEARKDLFERAYRYNSELPIAIYCNVVLGIITGISYMIATCIEFIKDPGTENFRISLDKVAYAKSKDHMIYNTLKSFNKTCENKEFDKAMEAVLKTSTKNFGGTVAAGGIAMAVLGTILILIPVLRELIFMFYYMRMKVSDFFDIQADLLQANAYSIEANKTLDKSEQKKIMAKQLKYVANFRKISNAFAIDMKKAEVESDKEKKSDDETKMLIDDIDGIDTGSNGSALF